MASLSLRSTPDRSASNDLRTTPPEDTGLTLRSDERFLSISVDVSVARRDPAPFSCRQKWLPLVEQSCRTDKKECQGLGRGWAVLTSRNG